MSRSLQLSETVQRGRRVDLFNGEDFHCALLGSLGFSSRLIAYRTGLTNSQIAYRLRKGQIRRMDYRNGESAFAERVISQTRKVALKELHAHLTHVLDL